ncbi:hypothetical protein SeLEV6574_g06308 [Synchytrium endobioticum]|uniref:Uncharacterized protein n=1 Tax=Synchytrium endobioticum TaxID=286115 RepID=A0A507CPC7_9FUNG|nr:hypothetical protein SeLEV6574_g06308 [Synchytrium endobioticum]
MFIFASPLASLTFSGQSNGTGNPVECRLVKKYMDGLAKEKMGTVKSARAIEFFDLIKIAKYVAQNPSPYNHMMHLAVVLAKMCCLRISELMSLVFDDFLVSGSSLSDFTYLMLKLKVRKTHQLGDVKPFCFTPRFLEQDVPKYQFVNVAALFLRWVALYGRAGGGDSNKITGPIFVRTTDGILDFNNPLSTSLFS